MKTPVTFYILVLAGALISIWVPLWYAPFVIALIMSLIAGQSRSKSFVIHLLIYALCSLIFCMYANISGSKSLISMIGELFKGLSLPLLVIISALFFALTAAIGAWLGSSLRRG
jgi:hypothetical protein